MTESCLNEFALSQAYAAKAGLRASELFDIERSEAKALSFQRAQLQHTSTYSCSRQYSRSSCIILSSAAWVAGSEVLDLAAMVVVGHSHRTCQGGSGARETQAGANFCACQLHFAV